MLILRTDKQEMPDNMDCLVASLLLHFVAYVSACY